MRSTMFLMVLSLALGPAHDVFAQEPGAWGQVAEAIPLGTKVKLQRVDGSRVSGALMRVDDTGVTISRNTRRPAPPVSIAFRDVARLERDTGGGIGVAKAVAIGLATGAGVILGLILFAMQLD